MADVSNLKINERWNVEQSRRNVDQDDRFQNLQILRMFRVSQIVYFGKFVNF